MRRLRWLGPAGVLASCLGGAHAEAQARSRTAVPDRRWMRPWADVLRMADRRVIDTAVVRAALAPDAPPALVTATLHAVGQIRDSASERLLVAALGDGRDVRAHAAAFALGALGRAGLADTTWARLEAVATGGGTGAAAAIRALVPQPVRAVRVARTVLSAPNMPRDARVAALMLSGLVRTMPPAPDSLMWSRDTVIARAAVWANARSRRAASVRGLLARATMPSPPTVLASVARGLARAAAGDSLADTARATVRRLSRHANAQVRAEATAALASYGGVAADDLLPVLTDAQALVRQVAADGLLAARRGDTAAVRLAWNADTALHMREVVLQAISTWTGDVAPAEARAWDTSPEWRRRGLHAQFVLPMRARWLGADASAFDAALADPEPRVRRMALDGMLAAGAPPFLPRGAPERLRAATTDASPLVRAAAWLILARSAADTADVPRALAAWPVAVQDTVDEDARTGIARFLAAAYARATTAPPGDTVARRDWRDEWTAAITALTPPADPAEAARLLPMFGRLRPAWAAASGPVAAADRPRTWYDSLVQAVVWPALAGRGPTASLVTTRGPITLALDGATAPLTVENFVRLARRGYFDGIAFHRVVPAFVVQGGDPTGTGSGGPGYAIRDELSPRPYERGELGMALSGPDTGGSQWFLTLLWQPHLDGGYTIFGRVRAGTTVLDALRQHDRILRIRVTP